MYNNVYENVFLYKWQKLLGVCRGIDSRFRENDEVMNAFMDSIAFGSRMTSLFQVLLLPEASVAGKLACTLPSRRAAAPRAQNPQYIVECFQGK